MINIGGGAIKFFVAAAPAPAPEKMFGSTALAPTP